MQHQVKRITPVDTFQYKVKPYDHQVTALMRSCFLPEFAYLMDMGTGKSKVIIDNFCILYEAGKITTVLIIAPKSVYRNWLLRELPEHVPDRIWSKTRIWIHPKNKPEELMDFMDGTDCLNIMLINVEAFSTQKLLCEILAQFMTITPTYMAVDESTTIRRKSNRTKAITILGGYAKYRRIATGQIAPNGPGNIFHQFQFLKNGCLGADSLVLFKHRFAEMIELGKKGKKKRGRIFNKTIGVKNVEELQRRMAPLSYRITKEECLDLPEQTYDFIHSDLDDASREYYEQMKRNAFVQIERDKGEPLFIQTQNRINMLMRLQRITCGHLKDPESGEEFRFSNKRITDTVEYLEFTKPPVIIWSVFTMDIVDLVAAIAAEYGKNSVMHYYGGTDTADKDAAITRLQAGDLDWLVANPASGRFGNTMTKASTSIYHSNSADLEFRDQSEQRIHRIGQRNPCLYLDVAAPNTVNYNMIMSLRKKINIATAVNGDKFKEWLV